MHLSPSPINIVVIGGVRPQYIKIAALQQGIDKFNQTSSRIIRPIYINSSQHYDAALSGDLINELNIHFDYHLTNIRKDPILILADIIEGLYSVFKQLAVRPDWVLVIGDTTTTLAGAITSVRMGYRVAHLEAGIRSGDLQAPEEMIRRVVDHISSLHLCITKSGLQNLAIEGLSTNAFWTGDPSYDLCQEISISPSLEGLGFPPGTYILVTLHKEINYKSLDILSTLIDVLQDYPRNTLFVTHPKAKRALEMLTINVDSDRIKYVDALPYRQMLSAIKGCTYIITDSGGLQKEAYYLGKRCLVRNNATGWSFLVEAGVHKLIGIAREDMLDGLSWIEEKSLESMPSQLNEVYLPNACNHILNLLVDKA